MCFGGTWRIPVASKLLDANFVDDLKSDGTYSELTFGREYESIWGGGNINSYFSPTKFDESRTLEEAVWRSKPVNHITKKERIILSYDVGRTSDQSSLVVLNLVPSTSATGTYVKQVVNLHNLDAVHFEQQAVFIKKQILSYNAEKLVIDGNGLGIGLVDFLTIEQIDPETGATLPALGVDPEMDKKGTYKKFYRAPNPEYDEFIFIVKATAAINSDIATLTSSQIESGKIQFLIDDQIKNDKLKRSAYGKSLTEEQRVKELIPYKLTRILREEMLNMKRKNGDNANVTLERISPRMKKDMYSAFSYGLWYARKLEMKNRNTQKGMKEMSFATHANIKIGTSRMDAGVRDRFKGGGKFRR